MDVAQPNTHQSAELQLLANINLFLRNLGVEAAEQLSAMLLSNPDHTIRELHRFVRRVQDLSVDMLLKEAETTADEMCDTMNAFVSSQRDYVNASNRNEFIVPHRAGAARVDAAKLDRETRMRLNVVHNFSGPLERSTFGPAHDTNEMENIGMSNVSDALDKRIGALECHLGLATGLHADSFQRLKQLEDRVCEIEHTLPAFAAFKFNQQSTETPHTSLLENQQHKPTETKQSAKSIQRQRIDDVSLIAK
ncbi:hypothetical protein BASA50_000913 [Batrachochytrium salamandrivorans]|uniref:GAT domain-containing protein n=1 Tax=Batrachochytrium salamandrivorans TaxID=1357716 RepID=A0ABQ8ESP0_9FUNG|nr:hypothetical protein BASA62_006213 [Batrachochytrium salamandrivorans]KAH6582290.1 hypothetical protein BASA60_002052 [Batrachochytrium salamandrivorans]KAH6585130.1 hypothetical protein BASA61_007053 [Batrachochytrium salamandrivorans]KAH6585969.1 hypothetical protein BASA50_000913 [Batrachochytrium salamandrivorans]KAH9275647.1 hypothetical protein BASA83_001944 [Batrachochytrium salamandrivorans]